MPASLGAVANPVAHYPLSLSPGPARMRGSCLRSMRTRRGAACLRRLAGFCWTKLHKPANPFALNAAVVGEIYLDTS